MRTFSNILLLVVGLFWPLKGCTPLVRLPLLDTTAGWGGTDLYVLGKDQRPHRRRLFLNETQPLNLYLGTNGVFSSARLFSRSSTLWRTFLTVSLFKNTLQLSPERSLGPMKCVKKQYAPDAICVVTFLQHPDVVFFGNDETTMIPPPTGRAKRDWEPQFPGGALVLPGPFTVHDKPYILVSHNIRHMYRFDFDMVNHTVAVEEVNRMISTPSKVVQGLSTIVFGATLFTSIYYYTAPLVLSDNIWQRSSSSLSKTLRVTADPRVFAITTTMGVVSVLPAADSVKEWSWLWLRAATMVIRQDIFLNLLEIAWSCSSILMENTPNAVSVLLSGGIAFCLLSEAFFFEKNKMRGAFFLFYVIGFVGWWNVFRYLSIFPTLSLGATLAVSGLVLVALATATVRIRVRDEIMAQLVKTYYSKN